VHSAFQVGDDGGSKGKREREARLEGVTLTDVTDLANIRLDEP
jgi:hypothetical protein